MEALRGSPPVARVLFAMDAAGASSMPLMADSGGAATWRRRLSAVTAAADADEGAHPAPVRLVSDAVSADGLVYASRGILPPVSPAATPTSAWAAAVEHTRGAAAALASVPRAMRAAGALVAPVSMTAAAAAVHQSPVATVRSAPRPASTAPSSSPAAGPTSGSNSTAPVAAGTPDRVAAVRSTHRSTTWLQPPTADDSREGDDALLTVGLASPDGDLRLRSTATLVEIARQPHLRRELATPKALQVLFDTWRGASRQHVRRNCALTLALVFCSAPALHDDLLLPVLSLCTIDSSTDDLSTCAQALCRRALQPQPVDLLLVPSLVTAALAIAKHDDMPPAALAEVALMLLQVVDHAADVAATGTSDELVQAIHTLVTGGQLAPGAAPPDAPTSPLRSPTALGGGAGLGSSHAQMSSSPVGAVVSGATASPRSSRLPAVSSKALPRLRSSMRMQGITAVAAAAATEAAVVLSARPSFRATAASLSYAAAGGTPPALRQVVAASLGASAEDRRATITLTPCSGSEEATTSAHWGWISESDSMDESSDGGDGSPRSASTSNDDASGIACASTQLDSDADGAAQAPHAHDAAHAKRLPALRTALEYGLLPLLLALLETCVNRLQPASGNPAEQFGEVASTRPLGASAVVPILAAASPLSARIRPHSGGPTSARAVASASDARAWLHFRQLPWHAHEEAVTGCQASPAAAADGDPCAAASDESPAARQRPALTLRISTPAGRHDDACGADADGISARKLLTDALEFAMGCLLRVATLPIMHPDLSRRRVMLLLLTLLQCRRSSVCDAAARLLFVLVSHDDASVAAAATGISGTVESAVRAVCTLLHRTAEAADRGIQAAVAARWQGVGTTGGAWALSSPLLHLGSAALRALARSEDHASRMLAAGAGDTLMGCYSASDPVVAANGLTALCHLFESCTAGRRTLLDHGFLVVIVNTLVDATAAAEAVVAACSRRRRSSALAPTAPAATDPSMPRALAEGLAAPGSSGAPMRATSATSTVAPSCVMALAALSAGDAHTVSQLRAANVVPVLAKLLAAAAALVARGLSAVGVVSGASVAMPGSDGSTCNPTRAPMADAGDSHRPATLCSDHSTFASVPPVLRPPVLAIAVEAVATLCAWPPLHGSMTVGAPSVLELLVRCVPAEPFIAPVRASELAGISASALSTWVSAAETIQRSAVRAVCALCRSSAVQDTASLQSAAASTVISVFARVAGAHDISSRHPAPLAASASAQPAVAASAAVMRRSPRSGPAVAQPKAAAAAAAGRGATHMHDASLLGAISWSAPEREACLAVLAALTAKPACHALMRQLGCAALFASHVRHVTSTMRRQSAQALYNLTVVPPGAPSSERLAALECAVAADVASALAIGSLFRADENATRDVCAAALRNMLALTYGEENEGWRAAVGATAVSDGISGMAAPASSSASAVAGDDTVVAVPSALGRQSSSTPEAPLPTSQRPTSLIVTTSSSPNITGLVAEKLADIRQQLLRDGLVWTVVKLAQGLGELPGSDSDPALIGSPARHRPLAAGRFMSVAEVLNALAGDPATIYSGQLTNRFAVTMLQQLAARSALALMQHLTPSTLATSPRTSSSSSSFEASACLFQLTASAASSIVHNSGDAIGTVVSNGMVHVLQQLLKTCRALAAAHTPAAVSLSLRVGAVTCRAMRAIIAAPATAMAAATLAEHAPAALSAINDAAACVDVVLLPEIADCGAIDCAGTLEVAHAQSMLTQAAATLCLAAREELTTTGTAATSLMQACSATMRVATGASGWHAASRAAIACCVRAVCCVCFQLQPHAARHLFAQRADAVPLLGDAPHASALLQTVDWVTRCCDPASAEDSSFGERALLHAASVLTLLTADGSDSKTALHLQAAGVIDRLAAAATHVGAHRSGLKHVDEAVCVAIANVLSHGQERAVSSGTMSYIVAKLTEAQPHLASTMRTLAAAMPGDVTSIGVASAGLASLVTLLSDDTATAASRHAEAFASSISCGMVHAVAGAVTATASLPSEPSAVDGEPQLSASAATTRDVCAPRSAVLHSVVADIRLQCAQLLVGVARSSHVGRLLDLPGDPNASTSAASTPEQAATAPASTATLRAAAGLHALMVLAEVGCPAVQGFAAEAMAACTEEHALRRGFMEHNGILAVATLARRAHHHPSTRAWCQLALARLNADEELRGSSLAASGIVHGALLLLPEAIDAASASRGGTAPAEHTTTASEVHVFSIPRAWNLTEHDPGAMACGHVDVPAPPVPGSRSALWKIDASLLRAPVSFATCNPDEWTKVPQAAAPAAASPRARTQPTSLIASLAASTTAASAMQPVDAAPSIESDDEGSFAATMRARALLKPFTLAPSHVVQVLAAASVGYTHLLSTARPASAAPARAASTHVDGQVHASGAVPALAISQLHRATADRPLTASADDATPARQSVFARLHAQQLKGKLQAEVPAAPAGVRARPGTAASGASRASNTGRSPASTAAVGAGSSLTSSGGSGHRSMPQLPPLRLSMVGPLPQLPPSLW